MLHDDIRFIELFFSYLEKEGIEFAILRNAEEVKENIAHDVDMSIDDKKLIEAEATVLNVANVLGWNLHLRLGSCKDKLNIKSYHFYKADSEQELIHIVHFDFFPAFVWQNYVLLENKEILESINYKTIYHEVSKPIEAIMNLFVSLLHKGCIKSNYKQNIFNVFCLYEIEVNSKLNCFLDSQISVYITDLVKNKNWSAIEKNRDLIIESIKKNARTRIVNRKKYLIEKAIKKQGTIVDFETAIGNDPSSIVAKLPDVLGRSFSSGDINYNPSKMNAESKVRGKNAKQNLYRLLSIQNGYRRNVLMFINSFFVNFYFVPKYWIKYRWQIARGHLVILERYYNNYYLYTYSRFPKYNSLIDMFNFVLIKPDVTFLLVGEANKDVKLKEEIVSNQKQRQIDHMLMYKKKYHNSQIIDISEPVEKIVYNIAVLILEAGRDKIERQ